jgi:predicted secreted protein
LNLFEGIVAYVIIWWVVLFMVLPWGISRLENPEVGQERGAPEKPRLWIKAGITTAISFVLLGLLWAIIHSGWISFRV